MIDLDKLERLAKTATSGLAGDRVMFAVHVMDPEGILALTTEVRRLRAEVELCEKLLADCREAAFSEVDNPYLGAAVGCPQDVPAFVSWEIQRLRTDAARYQWAISREDRAEELYGAVLSNCPDSAAIDAEIDLVRTKEPT